MSTNLLERLAMIDPHPVDQDPPIGAVTAASVLHDIEWRTDMKTQEHPQKETAPRNRSRLVAIAAFAAVVVVGLAVVLASEPTDSGRSDVTTTVGEVVTTTAPNTASTTTTQAPPTTVAAASDPTIVEAAFSALNAGDVEAFMALVDEGATIRDGLFRGDNTVLREALGRDAVFGFTIGRTYTLNECDETANGMRCTVDVTDDLREGVGAAPVTKAMTFRTVGGRIVVWLNQSPGEIGQGQALIDFQRWNTETNPDDPRLVAEGAAGGGNAFWTTVGDAPSVTPQRILEYLASVGG